MNIRFYKYQGTGNDFVILDNRKQLYDSLNTEQVKLLCNRKFGIGGDGLMLLNDHPEYDFEMKYFNADGNEGSMCGNGGRCLVKFASDMGMHRSLYRFLAFDGAHEASLDNGVVALKMNDVHHLTSAHGNYILDTGSPHMICFENDLQKTDVFSKGRAIRYSPDFEQKGINVNFVEAGERKDRIKVRTYERGVENETLSCGTGVTAAALVCYHNETGFNHVEVETPGGILSVEFEKNGNTFTNIWLSGPASKVFEGEIEIKETW